LLSFSIFLYLLLGACFKTPVADKKVSFWRLSKRENVSLLW
jgi:hypothetical protein